LHKLIKEQVINVTTFDKAVSSNWKNISLLNFFDYTTQKQVVFHKERV